MLRAARARITRLTPAQARHAVRMCGGLIVDIRSRGPARGGGRGARGALRARNVLERRGDARGAHADPVLLACRGPLVLMVAEGFQSSLAAATLLDLGRARATDMIGGLEAWARAGLPVLALSAAA
jgi:rhodanese-related sulfurtransferase